MEYSAYQHDNRAKRVVMDFGDYVFDQSDLTENLEYSQKVNPDGDFMIGVSSSAQLSFEIVNQNQSIPDQAVTGKEFIFRAGIQTATSSILQIYKRIRRDILCLNGTIAYAGNSRTPYLTVWDIQGEPVQLNDPEQPELPVKSLLVVNGKLYCIHDQEPYVTAYQIAGHDLRRLSAVSLNAFQRYKLAGYAKQGICFNLTGNLLKEYTKVLYSFQVRNYVETSFEFSQVGVFLAEKPDRSNDDLTRVTAYDRMIKTDVVIDEWNRTMTYPVSAGAMLKSLCSWLQLPLKTETFLNSDFVIPKNYDGENVTGRQVIQWIAQLAACYSDIDSSGSLRLRWYSEVGYSVDESAYTEITISEYSTAPVDKIQVHTTENDIGVIEPPDAAGTNIYLIENNPLLYAESDLEIRPVVKRIFEAIHSFSYTPYTVHSYYGNPLIRAGDVIDVKTLKGQSIKAVIMSRRLTGINALKDAYAATGEEIRSVQSDAVNQSIQQLRGRTNELNRTIDETNSRLTDLGSGLRSEISQTASTIRQELTNTETGLNSKIEQTASQLQTQITSNDGDISALTQTAQGFAVDIRNAQGAITSLKSTADGLSANVTDAKNNISFIQLSLSGFYAAVNNAKLTFDQNGLTITNGGFRIKNGSEEVMYIGSDGHVHTVGSLVTTGDRFTTTISGGKIEIRRNESGVRWFNLDDDGINTQDIRCRFIYAMDISVRKITASDDFDGKNLSCTGTISALNEIRGASLRVSGSISCGSINAGFNTITCGSLESNSDVTCRSLNASSSISCSSLSVGFSRLQQRTATVPNSYGTGTITLNYWGY